jgi:RNA polymerase sigma factor (sigma-70 family)
MPHTPTLRSESRVRSTAGDLHAGTLSCGSLRHQSDERLVALTRGGSERAFSEITRRYQRPLRSYCSRLVGAERAQDAVQQALLQAFLSLRDGAPRQIALRPWLYRIAHNCSVDLLRMGSWEYEQLDLEFDGVAQPPAVLEQKEELRGLIAGMRRLPDAQRQALALRELEGCSYEEISARLGHTGSGVRQLIFRARTTLRKGVSALLPFGMLRERLCGMAPAVDCHQVAGAVAVPAASGNGLETLSAAALAVVAVLGGVAGGVRGGHQRQSGDAREPRSAAVAAPPASRAPFGVPTAVAADPATARHRDGARRAPHGAPAAPAVAQGAPALPPAPVLPPATIVQQAPPPVAPAAETPAPASAPSASTGDTAAVEQQLLAPAPGDATQPAARPTQPPVVPLDGAPAAPMAPAPVGTPPAKPKPKPPAKPKLPAKPKAPAAQVPGSGSKPAVPTAPSVPAGAPGRPQKPGAPVRPKKQRPATVRAAAPL